MPTAADVLDRDFLSMRCRLIELAAALDRIDRAQGSAADDPGWPRSAAASKSSPALRPIGPSACKWSFPCQPRD